MVRPEHRSTVSDFLSRDSRLVDSSPNVLIAQPQHIRVLCAQRMSSASHRVGFPQAAMRAYDTIDVQEDKGRRLGLLRQFFHRATEAGVNILDRLLKHSFFLWHPALASTDIAGSLPWKSVGARRRVRENEANRWNTTNDARNALGGRLPRSHRPDTNAGRPRFGPSFLSPRIPAPRRGNSPRHAR